MRSKYLLVGVVVAVLFSVTATAIVLAGNLDPANPPASTSSYTLEDIYNRLNAGTAGSESTFTEPSSGPGTGTMHTLNDLMGAAPAVDDTHGAAPGEVLASKTYWGLSSGAWGPQMGTGPGAGVPKTGQTTSDEDGDDGDLQKGVAWPNPRFADNGDGTVTDNLTGLIWLENANCDGLKTWANALTWANGLNDGCESCGGTNTDCGLSDGSIEGEWRLPNLRELQSLVHYGVYDPAVPNTTGLAKWTAGDPFANVLSNHYWSSTTQGVSSNAWNVHLHVGYVGGLGKDNSVYVWPVRGGQ